MMLPSPIATSPPQIVHEIRSDKTINRLCNPYLRTDYSNMRYDLFLENVATKTIKGVCMTNNQRMADIIMKNGSHQTIYFPDNYDIINYLLMNDIPTELRQESDRPSIIDIISLMLQAFVVRLIAQMFSFTNSTKFEDFIIKIFNTDFHNLIQYLYSLNNKFTKEDINHIMRKITCNIYINRKRFKIK